jgi:hypothetical protein
MRPDRDDRERADRREFTACAKVGVDARRGEIAPRCRGVTPRPHPGRGLIRLRCSQRDRDILAREGDISEGLRRRGREITARLRKDTELGRDRRINSEIDPGHVGTGTEPIARDRAVCRCAVAGSAARIDGS